MDGYRNLILLCPTHHKEVDDQPAEYTIEALREIKLRHEEWVDETLEWRAGLPDAFWTRIREEATEYLAARVGDIDEDLSAMLEALGSFVSMTADLLGAGELVLFIRADNARVSLAYGYVDGAVRFAHSDGEGFHMGFSAFDRAPSIEDRTNEVRALDLADGDEDENPLAPFLLAAATLTDVVERIGSDEAVLYIRASDSSEAPEFALRAVDGASELAAGPAETFDAAHRSFSRQDPVDITHAIRIQLFLAKYTQAMENEDDDMAQGLLANFFAVSVLSALEDGWESESVTRERKELFATLCRDRFYEALLMLRLGYENPQDPGFRTWAEAHADPAPKDGLRAVLPSACIEVVHEYARSAAIDDESEEELVPDALDRLYEAISLIERFDEDEEVQEALAILTLENLEWWGDPQARPEILALVEGSGARPKRT